MSLANHFRRFWVVYAVVGSVAFMAVLFPTAERRTTARHAQGEAREPSPDATAGWQAHGPGPPGLPTAPPSSAGTTTGNSRSSRLGGGATPGPSVDAAPPSGAGLTPHSPLAAGTSQDPGTSSESASQPTTATPETVSRRRFSCAAGGPQLGYGEYSAPCVATFEGSNGGSTSRGVSPTQIRLALRVTSDYTDLDPEASARWRLINALISHFNAKFQLYGREVVVTFVRGQGRYLDELLGYGREQACIDAARLRERGYFGILAQTTDGSRNVFATATEPFSRCAAKNGLFVFRGALNYPERDFAEWHPYVWGLMPHCERIADNIVEYVGRRLGTRPARWAGDPEYRASGRVYGLYHPDNDSYRWCADRFIARLDEVYGIKIKTKFAYRLELALLDSQALSAAGQFKSDGVSTIILANDPRSQAALTNGAESIGWRPEWVNVGVDCQDCDGAGRRYNQNQAHGHMFGPSAASNPRRDANAEAYRAIHEAGITDAEEADIAMDYYYPLVDVFNKLQVAGPHLSAENIALGLAAMPARGSPTSAWGRWSYRGDHTAVDDFREVYWHRDATSWDGRKGAWLMTYGGRRFTPDAWPTEEPPIYP